MARALLTFAFYRGESLVARRTVTEDIIKIGTDGRSHLRVEDDQAARMHAIIEVIGPSEAILTDLGHDPPTLVNGVAVNRCALRVGDRVQIGRTTLVLEVSRAPAADEGELQALRPQVSFSPRGGWPGVATASSNPFIAAAMPASLGEAVPAVEAFEHVSGQACTYAMIKNGPEVRPEEVERPGVCSVEVMILWGTNVLHVAHLTPPRDFYVGESQGPNQPTDFFLPAEKLGATRLRLLRGDQHSVALVIPPSAEGTVELPGAPRLSLAEARRQASPSADGEGTCELVLPSGGKASVIIDQFVFQVSSVNAGRKIPTGVGASLDWAVASYFGLSLFAHAGFIAAMALFVPPVNLTDDEGMDSSKLRTIQQYLVAAAEREAPESKSDTPADTTPDEREGGSGKRAADEEGAMGNPISRETNRRYGVEGPKENQDPHLARVASLHEAQYFGMIGILNASGGDPKAPTAPWGRDESLGTDEVSARGNLWGDEIGDAYGAAGLGLSGIGEGGGGYGEGVGLGDIGTIGHGAGTGPGQGFGRGTGRMGPGHGTRAPVLRVGTTQASGRLPPEIIQRIVRQNHGRFRLCYEQGLTKNPNLEGRVTVRFVIGRDGAVSNAANGGSDLADSGVVQCVVGAYYGLSFPPPDGGIVTVVYPIAFSPG